MGVPKGDTSDATLQRAMLFGGDSHRLQSIVESYANLALVESDPDVVVCYGGDGTLLAAELRWPGTPKVPILNSHRGHRCIPHPPEEVIQHLAEGSLIRNEYVKLLCTVNESRAPGSVSPIVALNEINVHMGHINSAVRFKLWLNEDPYDEGVEVLGDGFVVCTPFGSTAYFRHITHGIFTTGLGIAFKATGEKTNHIIVPDDTVMRIEITRGPAVLAFDSSQEYITLEEGDILNMEKHRDSATILTCGAIKQLSEPF
jgi:NAD+ kinase